MLGALGVKNKKNTHMLKTMPRFECHFEKHTKVLGITLMHSSDIRNTNIFRRCSKKSIFKYLKKNIIMIQRLENWPLYQVFSSIFKKAQKNV
jgi:hypothetical protein